MEIRVKKEQDGKTLKELLFRDMGLSGGMVKKLKFRENGITVNGKHVTVRYILRDGDIINLDTDDTEAETCPYMIPVELPLKIAYEDDDITVVDKPPMMPAHPSYQHRLDTVANALAYRYSDRPFVFRPVNRLDRDTSGLMLTARTRMAASKMYEYMVTGQIHKTYIALIEKAPAEKSGTIETYMKRKEGSIIERCVCSPEEKGAKIAVTRYETVFEGDGVCAVLASPITGRTHQLRVHFSHIGCPLLGDVMYGGSEEKIERHALHSAYLTFPYPEDGRKMEFFSQLPEDMRNIEGLDAEAVERKLKEYALQI